MRKGIKKAISVLIVAVMLFSIAPLSGFVGLELPSFAEIFNKKAEAATSGTCGDNLTWTFNESTGKLIISGTGDMYDFASYSYVPWYNYRSSIKSVSIGNRVTSIGRYAFYYCESLTSVNIPDSVTSIGSSAFEDCMSLTSVNIPDSVTSIGSAAFSYCTNLASVAIPDGVTSIGNFAFEYCRSLTSVNIPDGVTSIGGYAFYYCESLTSITIPDSVTRIGSYAFYNCTSLTSVTIPDSVTSIGDRTFMFCTSLKSIRISNSITTIGYAVFDTCESLASITIPDGVTSIGDQAFLDCDSLTSVTIPDSVTSIGYQAFYLCDKLTSITIPYSVTSIGDQAFCCVVIESITVDENNKNYSSDEYGVLFNKDKTTLVQCPRGIKSTSYTIPDSVTSIGADAFSGCNSLESVTIPDGVASISNDAFYGCSSLTDVYYPGTEAEWNAISIGSYNEKLTNATIHYNYGKEPPTAFGECGENLTWKFYESTGELVISGTGEMYDWLSSSAPWYKYRKSIKSVTIGNSVTSIGNYAFCLCKSLTSITIPDSVTTIGYYAFNYCTSLTSVTIGNSVTTIGTSAFCECKSLTSVTIGNSVTKIGDAAFENCTSLTSVIIPDSVTTIVEFAFYGCESLESVVIPDSVTTIGISAFRYCTRLTSVTIGNSVTSIGNYAFSGCDSLASITVDKNNPNYSSDEYGVLFNKSKTKLIQYPIGNERTSYVIPDSVTSIDGYAFDNCTSLTSITIPDGVTRIDNGVFYGCESLSDVYYTGTEAEWNAISIGSYNENLTNATIHYNHIHAVSTVKVNVDPTCNENGYKTGECVCGYSLTEEIPALNHKDTLIKVDAKAPTCTEIGWDAYEYCTACTYTTYVEKDALKHDIVIDKAVEATCTETGLTAGQHCSRCDDMTVAQEVIPALNHKDTLVKVDAKAPTCTEIGWDAYEYCTACTYTTYVEKVALKHDIVIDKAVDATCTETGLTAGQHCSRCDDVTVEQEVIPALNHKDTLVRVDAKAPTCTEIGWDAYEYCTACDYTTYAEKEALKHNIIIDEAVSPTCTSTGLTAGQHCSRCDDMTVEQEVVPVKLHNPTEKYDSSKHWKECVCGLKTNEENHSFNGGNVCSCGYRRTVNATLSIKNNMGSKTINYGETLKLTVNVTNKPTNAKIYWYVDGVKRAEGEVFDISFENGSKIVTVKLVDANGVAYEDSNGNEISDSQTVTVNGGFFQKIISFFKNLFGMNRTVVQVLTGRL